MALDSGDGNGYASWNPALKILTAIANIPNDVVGLIVGLAGLPFGGENWHFDSQNLVLEITGNKLTGGGAITFGNVINYGSDPNSFTNDGNTFRDHELQHVGQGGMLGPLYLPANIVGIFSGLFIGGGRPGDPTHGPGNFMETGPQSHPPRPFSWFGNEN